MNWPRALSPFGFALRAYKKACENFTPNRPLRKTALERLEKAAHKRVNHFSAPYGLRRWPSYPPATDTLTAAYRACSKYGDLGAAYRISLKAIDLSCEAGHASQMQSWMEDGFAAARRAHKLEITRPSAPSGFSSADMVRAIAKAGAAGLARLELHASSEHFAKLGQNPSIALEEPFHQKPKFES